MLTHVVIEWGKLIGDGNDDDGSGNGSKDVYNGKAKPVLVSVSDSYSDDDTISVSNSRYSSYPTYTDTDYFYQLTTALIKAYVILF